MPASFRIFPERGLVYVRFTGRALVSQSVEAFASYMRHPDFAPGQKHLVDASAVTSVENDYTALMAHQAQMIEAFRPEWPQSLVVFFAPTAAGLTMARMTMPSWKGLDHLIPVVVEEEAEALKLLGQPEGTIASLMATTG